MVNSFTKEKAKTLVVGVAFVVFFPITVPLMVCYAVGHVIRDVFRI